MRKLVYAWLVILLCCSCAGRIDGSLKTDGSAELSLEASLQPRMATLIRTFQILGGQSNPGPLLDGPGIAQAMTAAPGISSVTIRNVNPSAIAGTIQIAQIGVFLTAPGPQAGNQLIQYDPAGKLAIVIDKQSGPKLLLLFSPEVREYLAALMAPVATGEVLSKGEYISLVASVYGQPVANEIVASQILVSLEFPRPISSIQGGTYQGRKAQFTVALADCLVLEKPLAYQVTW